MSNQRGKYLSKKSYHPTRHANQQKLFEAQQQANAEAARIEERRNELKAERIQSAAMQTLPSEDHDAARNRESVSFLYRAPPGFFRNREAEEEADRERKESDPRLL